MNSSGSFLAKARIVGLSKETILRSFSASFVNNVVLPTWRGPVTINTGKVSLIFFIVGSMVLALYMAHLLQHISLCSTDIFMQIQSVILLLHKRMILSKKLCKSKMIILICINRGFPESLVEADDERIYFSVMLEHIQSNT